MDPEKVPGTPVQAALAEAMEITAAVSPGVGKLDSFVGKARRVAAALIEAGKQRERLQVRLNCANAALQNAPQPPPGPWAAGFFLDEYRPWWIRRLTVYSDLAIDAATEKA